MKTKKGRIFTYKIKCCAVCKYRKCSLLLEPCESCRHAYGLRVKWEPYMKLE